MNAEQLEKWLQENKTQDCEPDSSMGMGFGPTFSVSEEKLRALFDGKVLVPVEPTSKMLHAAYDNCMMGLPISQSTGHRIASEVCKSMLAASQEQGQ